MTDVDPQADIEVHSADEHVTVRVPLAGAVTGEWLRCYQQLALAKEVPVQPQVHHDRAWIVVSVPASSSQGEVAATLDGARALIADADAEQPPAMATAEASVRDWWAGRRESGSRGHGSVTGAAQAQAERRWPMAFTLVLAMVVPLLLPARFSLGPPWAVPVVEALLLVAIVAIDRGRIDRRSAAGRVLSLGLLAVLVVDAAGVTARLVVDLVEGGRRQILRRIFSRPVFWSGSTRSLPLPSSIGCLTEGVLNRASWLHESSPRSPSLRSSTRGWLRPAGALNSSTTSTSALPTPPRSAQPM